MADGFCIGMMKDGQRVIAPAAAEFFANIVRDEQLREPGDFCSLARLHEWVEDYTEAGAVLDQAEALYPAFWEIPFQRAAFRVRAEDHRGAMDAASGAAELAPWKTQTWELLGKIYGDLGRLAHRPKEPADGPRKSSGFESSFLRRLMPSKCTDLARLK
ncbi:MAG: hypothetical protein IPJ98_16880 [Bryobacterales bacterium]|nr:hypothetical protein [Bryobacterales bacterium]